MMGSNEKPQNQLFYSFNLDEVVPEDHLLRHIDRLLGVAVVGGEVLAQVTADECVHVAEISAPMLAARSSFSTE